MSKLTIVQYGFIAAVAVIFIIMTAASAAKDGRPWHPQRQNHAQQRRRGRTLYVSSEEGQLAARRGQSRGGGSMQPYLRAKIWSKQRAQKQRRRGVKAMHSSRVTASAATTDNIDRFVLKCHQDDIAGSDDNVSAKDVKEVEYKLCFEEIARLETIRNAHANASKGCSKIRPIKIDVVNTMDTTPALFVVEIQVGNCVESNGDSGDDVVNGHVLDEIRRLPHVDAVEPDYGEYFWLEGGRFESEIDYENEKRNLGQYQDYGIRNVQADKVWDFFGKGDGDAYDIARGSRSKVCVLDSGFKSTHFDVDSNRLNGTNFDGFDWVS